MGNLSALPTDDAIFVEGALTLLKPTGLSESPARKGGKSAFNFGHLTTLHFNFNIYISIFINFRNEI